MVRGLFAGLNYRRLQLYLDSSNGLKRNDLEIVVPHDPKAARLIDDNGMIMNIEIGAAAVNGIAFHPQKFPGRAKLHLCLLLNCTFFCRSLDRIEKAPYSDPFFVVV